MKLDLYREPSANGCTLGKLYVEGIYECETLEDTVRDSKISHETAIPAGKYAIDITYSPHFRKDLPLLLKVPNYDGVRIHPGNVAADTDGCILVGKNRSGNAITSSRLAFENLFTKLDRAQDEGEKIEIEIHPTP